MRILHVSPYFTPEMGGAAQVVYQSVKSLVERGHEVTVLSSNYHVRNAHFDAAGYQEVLLPISFAGWGFYLTPGLADWLKKNINFFDVIHLHTLRTFQNAVLYKYAISSNIPYVLSAHGTLPIILQRRSAKAAFDIISGRAIVENASRLIAVSDDEIEQYITCGVEPSRIRLIYNGLDLFEFERLPERGLFREQWGIGNDRKVVLYLGRLHHQKNIHHLIEALFLLSEQLPALILMVTGPDEGDRSRLEALVSHHSLNGKVCFTGSVYGRDRLSVLRDADVLVSPAAYEVFGLSPFEALMCSSPVIVTEASGLGRLIRQAAAGYTYPAGDVRALADMLKHVLSNPGDAEEKISAGQSFIRRNMDWTRISIRLENLYLEVKRHAGSS